MHPVPANVTGLKVVVTFDLFVAGFVVSQASESRKLSFKIVPNVS